MSHFYEKKILEYTPNQLYQLVLDVEKYPLFLPWCNKVTIIERMNEGCFLADMHIKFKALSYTYRSKVTHTMDHNYEIKVDAISGVFSYLHNKWQFYGNEEGKSVVEFSIDFKFNNSIFNKLVEPLFAAITHKMISCFEKRANAVYG